MRTVLSFKPTRRVAVNYSLNRNITVKGMYNTILSYQNSGVTTINVDIKNFKKSDISKVKEFIEIARTKGLDVNLTVDVSNTEIMESLNDFKGLTGVYFTNVNSDNVEKVKETVSEINFSVMPDVYVKVDNVNVLDNLKNLNVKVVVNSELKNKNKDNDELQKYEDNKKLVIEYDNSEKEVLSDNEIFISQEVFNKRKDRGSLFNKIMNLTKSKTNYYLKGYSIGEIGIDKNFDILSSDNNIRKLLIGKDVTIDQLKETPGLTQTVIDELDEINELDDNEKIEAAKKLFIGIIGKREFEKINKNNFEIMNPLDEIWKDLSADHQAVMIMSLVQLKLVDVDLDESKIEAIKNMTISQIRDRNQDVFNEMLSLWNSGEIKFEDKLQKEKENKIKELVEVDLKFGDMLISERNAGNALQESMNVSVVGIKDLLSAA